MELKSAMKTFFPFKIVCNDRGKPCSSDWKSWSFQMKKNIVVKYKIKSKKIILSFAECNDEKDKPMTE